MLLTHEIEIRAAAAEVWQTTLDWARWPEWTPTVTKVEVNEPDRPIGIGSSAVLTQPGLPPTRWTVTEFEPPRSFTWEARVRGMRFRATHVVTGDEKSARSEIVLEVSGALATLLGWALRGKMRAALAQENEGLRRYCEA